MTYMYEETETWNVIKGCLFNCNYCEKSFQLQAKRQKHRCIDCYNYVPHFHPERLKRYLPKNKLIFCCASGDIAFAKTEWIQKVLDEIRLRVDHTFLLQTKKPSCLKDFAIPENVIIGTTIETNRDTKHISKAPDTTMRKIWLNELNCRKAVTMEPILDFDMLIVIDWIRAINPEIVWIGYANHTENLRLDEPDLNKTRELIRELKKFTDVRLKTIRDKL